MLKRLLLALKKEESGYVTTAIFGLPLFMPGLMDLIALFVQAEKFFKVSMIWLRSNLSWLSKHTGGMLERLREASREKESGYVATAIFGQHHSAIG